MDVWTVEVDRALAEQIRRWRGLDEATWRRIASLVTAVPARLGLPHSTNQIAGQRLCEDAARMLGEDPNREPWN
ncbi:hypothetical protein ABZU76_09265 [Amycolatopsis sp. NPDC005232]|uniref:hypothetical protein n=1 Tax=Amycolatopsis sp. NPDC005232 TaxID=3157027 RepID=UPI0033BDCDC4